MLILRKLIACNFLLFIDLRNNWNSYSWVALFLCSVNYLRKGVKLRKKGIFHPKVVLRSVLYLQAGWFLHLCDILLLNEALLACIVTLVLKKKLTLLLGSVVVWFLYAFAERDRSLCANNRFMQAKLQVNLFILFSTHPLSNCIWDKAAFRLSRMSLSVFLLNLALTTSHSYLIVRNIWEANQRSLFCHIIDLFTYFVLCCMNFFASFTLYICLILRLMSEKEKQGNHFSR